MKATIATSISALTRSLDRRLATSVPLSRSGYLALAISGPAHAQPLRWLPTRENIASARQRPASASEALARYLSRRWHYRRVRRAVARWNKAYRTRSAAFVSTALRQVGIVVPRDRAIDGLGAATVTRGLSRYLEDGLGWRRIEQTRELVAGDIVFSTDAPCCPGIPHHVLVFMDWRDPARTHAQVVDHRGHLTCRPLFRSPSAQQVEALAGARPVVQRRSPRAAMAERAHEATEAPFAYALRAGSARARAVSRQIHA